VWPFGSKKQKKRALGIMGKAEKNPVRKTILGMRADKAKKKKGWFS